MDTIVNIAKSLEKLFKLRIDRLDLQVIFSTNRYVGYVYFSNGDCYKITDKGTIEEA